jgi:hypothetical protein
MRADVSDEDLKMIYQHEAYELSFLYSSSSPTNDMVVNGALFHDIYDSTDKFRFILDLTEFRKLRDSDAAERSEINVPGK